MLGDITVAPNIYIACGYTDMRKFIDGLAVIVQEQFHLDPFSKSLFLVNAETGSNVFYGKVMAFCFFTNGWKTEASNGHAKKVM